MKYRNTHLIVKVSQDAGVAVDYHGTKIDLIKILAVAMDIEFLRSVFYAAVALDKEHDAKIGRRQNIIEEEQS